MWPKSKGRAALLAVALVGVAGIAAIWGLWRATAPSESCYRAPVKAGTDEVFVQGGTFDLGAGGRYPEEVVRAGVVVRDFWIDRTEVTNAQFAAFVKATGYVTLAERIPSAEEFPDLSPAERRAGGAVFTPPAEITSGADVSHWWRFVPGASWRQPEGPGSTIDGRENRPVVQIAYPDAAAYARWAGRALPTEAEWEWAARDGTAADTAAEPRGRDGRWQANAWQGAFPLRNDNLDGYTGIAPVGCYAANGRGLYDMVGNVWEWTADPYSDPAHPSPSRISHVIKGGSFLCAANYCARYRPAARQPGASDLGTSHVGFRTIRRSG